MVLKLGYASEKYVSLTFPLGPVAFRWAGQAASTKRWVTQPTQNKVKAALLIGVFQLILSVFCRHLFIALSPHPGTLSHTPDAYTLEYMQSLTYCWPTPCLEPVKVPCESWKGVAPSVELSCKSLKLPPLSCINLWSSISSFSLDFMTCSLNKTFLYRSVWRWLPKNKFQFVFHYDDVGP